MSKILVAEGVELDEAQELADFFDNAPIGMLWVGADGTVLRANKFKLAMLGYEEEEFVGKNIGDFHPDQENLHQAFDRLARGETLENFPVGLLCKDGSVKRLLLNSNARCNDGKFVHTRCVTRPEA